jgi:asparagine synthase (glutamine-hydrolysing)
MMCGIPGYVGHIDRMNFLQCLHPLEHRGPDGTGIRQTPDICLGHLPLACLDLSAKDKKPMSCPDARYWITHNGEAYNFLELRRKLATIGHRFETVTDTEVILAAFMAWGPKCLDRLKGMCGLANTFPVPLGRCHNA